MNSKHRDLQSRLIPTRPHAPGFPNLEPLMIFLFYFGFKETAGKKDWKRSLRLSSVAGAIYTHHYQIGSVIFETTFTSIAATKLDSDGLMISAWRSSWKHCKCGTKWHTTYSDDLLCWLSSQDVYKPRAITTIHCPKWKEGNFVISTAPFNYSPFFTSPVVTPISIFRPPLRGRIARIFNPS